jgi:hypothetical protein
VDSSARSKPEHDRRPLDARSRGVDVTLLGEVADRANRDELHDAYKMLQAVLHALRDRVEPDVAAHLAAQLPLLAPFRSPMCSWENWVAGLRHRSGPWGKSVRRIGIAAMDRICGIPFCQHDLRHLL